MNNHDIKLKIQKLILNRDVFSEQTSKIQIRTRCPFCGDSQKNLHTGHLYLRINPDDNLPIVYNCFKCPAQGILKYEDLESLGISDDDIKKNISSLNIRICKEVIGASNKVMRLITQNNRVYNTLIVSPPKCGKTTILRDIAKNLSNGMYQINLKGKKVTIVDERSEIAACYNGIPQMNVGIRTDILDNCLKKSGMIMAIRSLSPEVLICDEIGTEGDLEALNMAFNSGVNIIVTVHGYDINDVYNRKVFKELIDNCVLERIILLSNRRGAGTIERVYKVSREKGLQCLEV